MVGTNSLKTAAVACVAAVLASGAAFAGSCQVSGATLTSIDGGATLTPSQNATKCFGAASTNTGSGPSGQISESEIMSLLSTDAWGFGTYNWSYVGKYDDAAPSSSPVSADLEQKNGSWSVDVTPNTANVFSLVLKGSTEYSSFLFDISPNAGSVFAGDYDMELAGIDADLSNIQVVGVYAGVIPLPAAAWLMIAAFGGLGVAGAVKKRRAALT